MIYFNENLRNWLLGKSEIDDNCSCVTSLEETPQQLLNKYQKTDDKRELTKISNKLSKLGYEIKTVNILSKKPKQNL